MSGEQAETAPAGKRPDFEIGLALAGAISAGAYTAGVIDFLMQALQAWEGQRDKGAPVHSAKIRTLAGASAGAITGALGVVALARGLRPVPLTAAEAEGSDCEIGGACQRIRCVIPTLYDVWVTRPRMVAAEGSDGPDFLGLGDLRPACGHKRAPVLVRSALNAELLDDIKTKALACPDPAPPPASFPFLSETLHVFMTVSNLRGIPFTVSFGNATYGMQTHGDRFHYAIQGVGEASWPYENWLEADRSIPLRTETLPWEPQQPLPESWDAYGTCALASSAFPVGLAPRLLTTPFLGYDGRQFPLPVTVGSIHVDFPPRPPGADAFTFLNVDGGMTNNNPFDYVEFALRGFPKQGETDGARADRAVLMVAPFPDPPAFLPEGQPIPELITVLRALFPTLINQARFRAAELGPAQDPDDHSRFVISPSRSLARGPEERYPIACGLLGGFGGFLDESFRAHDFQLGRRNCQRFLASIFGLPETNPAIRKTADATRRIPLAPRGDEKAGTEPKFMIVPLVGDAAAEVALPHWPQMSGKDFRTLTKRIGGRLDAIVKPVIEAQTSKWLVRAFARFTIFFARGRIMKYVETAILADLVRRNQIRGWDLPDAALTAAAAHKGGADDVRAILATLIALQGSATAATLAAATHLDTVMVRRVLDILAAVGPGVPFRAIARPGGAGPAYMLETQVPTGVRALPLIGAQIESWRPAPYAYD